MKNPAPDLALEQDKGCVLGRLADGKITILYFSNTKPPKKNHPTISSAADGGWFFIEGLELVA